MDSKKIILAVAFILLVLSGFGCMTKTDKEFEDYKKGTKGLEMNLVKNLPPDEIWKQSEFIIAVELKNSGAADIQQGIITINYNKKYLYIQEPQKTFELKGKQQGYPEGEFNLIEFKAKNTELPSGEESPGSFVVTANYEYQTIADEEICINPEIYNLAAAKSVCETKPVEISGGQGAPIAVTSINAIPSPKGPDLLVLFTIEIENKDNGKILSNITITDAELSNQKIQCPKSITLDKQENGIIACSTILKNKKSAYIAPFVLKLDYKYALSIDKKLKITDPLLK